MAKQGRCRNCHTVFFWPKERPLKEVKCPICGKQLTPTTHLCKDRQCFLHYGARKPGNTRTYPEQRNYDDNWSGSTDNTERLVEREYELGVR